MASPIPAQKSTFSFKQIEEQQKQIELLTTSLENILEYLKSQNSEVNGALTNLSNTTEQLIEYLPALIHSSDALKKDVDAIGPVILTLHRAMEKRYADHSKELQSLQKGREDTHKAIVGIRKVMQQLVAQQLEWKQLIAAMLGVALVSSIASGVTTYFVISATQSNSRNALAEKDPKNSSRQGSKKTTVRTQSSR
jgi:chromosome segregation ATPase